MHLRKHVSEPWFSYLLYGEKVVEGRLGRPEFRSLMVDDMITFYNEDREVTFSITRVMIYRSFSEMLIMEGLSRVLPGIYTLEGGISIYRQYFTPEDEELYGVVAIEVYVTDSLRRRS